MTVNEVDTNYVYIFCDINGEWDEYKDMQSIVSNLGYANERELASHLHEGDVLLFKAEKIVPDINVTWPDCVRGEV